MLTYVMAKAGPGKVALNINNVTPSYSHNRETASATPGPSDPIRFKHQRFRKPKDIFFYLTTVDAREVPTSTPLKYRDVATGRAVALGKDTIDLRDLVEGKYQAVPGPLSRSTGRPEHYIVDHVPEISSRLPGNLNTKSADFKPKVKAFVFGGAAATAGPRPS